MYDDDKKDKNVEKFMSLTTELLENKFNLWKYIWAKRNKSLMILLGETCLQTKKNKEKNQEKVMLINKSMKKLSLNVRNCGV